ncbi:hypothetical protein JOD31_001735 [Methylopila capsulata]|uniref:Uncharacterized protein n=1 Tax=Methylopila capsulata TaxID=61654 RepID=A0A9W6MQS8_9HYPH|nr:hypothetical protein [Methylopila capsulata]MBM7851510.1 hypothetical protein [Methylopila capsulata]GLK54568.1 hypothetical protein GCM10008170_05870 [Methylopila capsulata]
MEFREIKVATDSADEDGRLVLHDGRLVAVIVRLDDPSHGPAKGQWSLEAGFNGVESTKPPLFANLQAAERWIELQIADHIRV